MRTKEEFSSNGETLLSSYSNYEGTLIDPKNGMIVYHDIRDEDDSLFEKTIQNVPESDDETSLDESSENEGVFEEIHEAFLDTTRGWLTIATNTLDEIAKQQQKSEEEKEALIDFFIKWVTGDPKLIIAQPYFLNYGITYWQKVYDDSLQAQFAHFILSLLCIPSCEAVCERAFWYQRRVLGDHSLRSGTNTEIHRINYLLQRKR